MRAYGYIYQADAYCGTCGDAICQSLTAQNKAPKDTMDHASFDSDDFPKSADVCGEESDNPEHCATCGEFLRNPLTSAGYAYVTKAINTRPMRPLANGLERPDIITQQWLIDWASWYGYRYYDAEDIADSLKAYRTPGWYSDEEF